MLKKGEQEWLSTSHSSTYCGHFPAGSFTSSTRAELIAIGKDLNCALGNGVLGSSSKGAEFRICTDSQAAVEMLKNGPSRQTTPIVISIWKRVQELSSRDCHNTIQWVPGHAGLKGNEASDAVAKKASEL